MKLIFALRPVGPVVLRSPGILDLRARAIAEAESEDKEARASGRREKWAVFLSLSRPPARSRPEDRRAYLKDGVAWG